MFRVTRADATSLGVCDDVFEIIFKDLRPEFLHSVLCASKAFNHVAMRDGIYRAKLQKYFPDLKIPNTSSDQPTVNNQLFHLFKKTYAERFFRNRFAKKLAASIVENDIQGIIQSFKIDLLYSQDTHNQTVLHYLNNQHNQSLRNLVFQLATDEVKRNKGIFLFLLQYSDYINARKGIYYMDDKLYALAAALNQIDIIKKYQPRQDSIPYHHSVIFMAAVRYNHFEVVSTLIEKGIWSAMSVNFADLGPLTEAAKNNSLVMTQLLLRTFGARALQDDISFAIGIAARNGSSDLVKALVSQRRPLNNIFITYKIAAEANHVDVLKIVEEHRETLSRNYNEEAHQQMLYEVLMATVKDTDKTELVEFLCSRINNLDNDKAEKLYVYLHPYRDIFLKYIPEPSREYAESIDIDGMDVNQTPYLTP